MMLSMTSLISLSLLFYILTLSSCPGTRSACVRGCWRRVWGWTGSGEVAKSTGGSGTVISVLLFNIIIRNPRYPMDGGQGGQGSVQRKVTLEENKVRPWTSDMAYRTHRSHKYLIYKLYLMWYWDCSTRYRSSLPPVMTLSMFVRKYLLCRQVSFCQ